TKILKNLSLDALVLGGGLDDEVAILHVVKVLGRMDTFERRTDDVAANETARRLPVHVAVNTLDCLFQYVAVYVVQNDVEARQREDVGDAVAHLSGADYADAFYSHDASRRSLVTELRQFLIHLRHRFEEVGDEAVVGDLKYRGFFVLVDRCDDLRILHSCQMLNRARYSHRDVELRRDHLAGLTDLIVVGDEARVDRRTRGTHRRMQLVGNLFEQVEILAGLHAPAAGNDDLGGGQFRPLGFGK